MASQDDLHLPGFDTFDGVDLVQRLPLFKTLAFDEMRRLFAVSVVEKRGKGEVIIEEHALGVALYVVKHGEVKVSRGDRQLGKMGVGELFGEMSLVDDVLTSAQVTAESDVELLVLPRAAFEELMQRDLGLAVKVYRAFCRTLSDRLRRANDQLPDDHRFANGVR